MSLLTEAARLEGNTAVFVIVTDDMVACYYFPALHALHYRTGRNSTWLSKT